VSDMNNLYVISKDDPNQMIHGVGLIDDRHYLRRIEDSPPRALDNPGKKKRVEHRYHKRFRLNQSAYALIRSTSTGQLNIDGKSMGCLACEVFNARPVKLGKIDNISMGGLMFHYVDSKAQISETFELDIVLADCGFYLANLPYKTITDVVLPEDDPGDPIEMRQICLQFKKLSVNQQAKLQGFIFNHGAETGNLGKQQGPPNKNK